MKEKGAVVPQFFQSCIYRVFNSFSNPASVPGSSRLLPGSSLAPPWLFLAPPWLRPGSALAPPWLLPGSSPAPPCSSRLRQWWSPVRRTRRCAPLPSPPLCLSSVLSSSSQGSSSRQWTYTPTPCPPPPSPRQGAGAGARRNCDVRTTKRSKAHETEYHILENSRVCVCVYIYIYIQTLTK